MISLILGALGRKLIPYAIGGVVVIAGVMMFAYYERGIGYGKCKAEWNEAIANTSTIIRDATDRARDERVPDPFDSDKP